MAALLTTTPPLPDIINYNLRGSYILLFGAWAATLAVVITGSAILYALTEIKREWLVTVCHRSTCEIMILNDCQ